MIHRQFAATGALRGLVTIEARSCRAVVAETLRLIRPEVEGAIAEPQVIEVAVHFT